MRLMVLTIFSLVVQTQAHAEQIDRKTINDTVAAGFERMAETALENSSVSVLRVIYPMTPLILPGEIIKIIEGSEWYARWIIADIQIGDQTYKANCYAILKPALASDINYELRIVGIPTDKCSVEPENRRIKYLLDEMSTELPLVGPANFNTRADYIERAELETAEQTGD